jgi:hypothetical protein
MVFIVRTELNDLLEDWALYIRKWDLFPCIIIQEALDQNRNLCDVFVNLNNFTITAKELNFVFYHNFNY